jgi:hypothetical protein
MQPKDKQDEQSKKNVLMSFLSVKVTVSDETQQAKKVN